jgi:hypothetical protein
MLGENQRQGATMEDTPHDCTEMRDYASYLLRLWRASTEEEAWRASLEDPRTGVRTGFANLDDLFAFLRQQGTALTRET